MNPDTELEKQLDRCVKCGMCLQVCPTYKATLNEAESPRGRISLIQGLVSNALPYSASLDEHIENCLKCRACEDVCPSDVAYGDVIDQAQAIIDKNKHNSGSSSWFKQRGLDAVANNHRLSRYLSTLRLLQTSGLSWPVGRILSLIDPALGRFLLDLPRLSAWQPGTEYIPAKNKHAGDVALFTGCIARSLDTTTLHSTISLLNKLGFGVHLPVSQACCGALHLHNGDARTADQLADKNREAFSNLKLEAVISTASGCGSVLKEYDPVLASEATHGVIDISAFLNTIEWPDNLSVETFNKTVAVHDPCSLRRIWREHRHVYALLEKIPGMTIVELPGNDQCCGAAGSYMLTHADMAAQLRDSKLDKKQLAAIDYLATSNIGCALHFNQGLKQQNLDITVLHPVVLLDQQTQVDATNRGQTP